MTSRNSFSSLLRSAGPRAAAVATAALWVASIQFAMYGAHGTAQSPPAGGADRVEHTTWRDYGGGPDSSKFVALNQIDKANVGRLKVAWTYPTSDALNYQFNPIVVDNVMYVLAKNTPSWR